MINVALVVGHKQTKPGAVNNLTGITEYQFNCKVVDDIINIMRNLNIIQDSIPLKFESITKFTTTINNNRINVYPVMRDGIRYSQLPERINKTKPDFIISFHANAYNKRASGSEVLYYHTSKTGMKIATILNERINTVLGLGDRGVKKIYDDNRGALVLRETNAPCVLIEPFFIDNDDNLKVVIDNYSIFIEAIVNSIITISRELFNV
jgi:N-acetylmuramoyl-L-alanine amidase